MGWAASDLVKALQRQVLELETDLRVRVDGDDHDARQPGAYEAWKADYDAAFAAERTAAAWQQWRNDRVTQAAVGWVLLTVFARYCEDNALASPRWIAGADSDERTQALDARRAYFQAHPEDTDREWLGQIIDHFANYPATAGLVDKFSPLHLVAPSGDAARALLEFWWQHGDDGEPAYSFSGVDTRFLGDVYQDLSEHAKKTYALLQTPEFVEEFILDQTMEPALADRPLEGFTVIDPTCGSGHFLLGAFHRLHERWQRTAPGLGARELVEKALDGVYGVDVNPFAVAIARFRLLVAALHVAGDSSIEQKIRYEPHLAAGDSLLWGADQQLLPEDLLAAGPTAHADSTENVAVLTTILQREHDVVVGNPPYITVKDAALNTMYRQLYSACHMKYALTVPFMQLFFRLAYGSGRGRPAGWVGQITSNSFMKREFGSKLIEQFLPTVDLRMVIDTSGAYIPGHGTPTVIIVGRHQGPSTGTVRAVLGIRGEPGRPDDPGKGLVWTSITQHVAEPGYEDQYVSVADLRRNALTTHPWSLSGGGAVELLKQINGVVAHPLAHHTQRIGVFGMTNADDVMLADKRSFSRRCVGSDMIRVLALGDEIRDWSITAATYSIFPYGEPPIYPEVALSPTAYEWLWPCKTVMGNRATFSKTTYFEEGRPWFEWHQLTRDADASVMTITFAFVATHNHFVLDRGGKVFKQSAPVIKLPEGASVEEHLRLLGVLNSSVACFWLKQNSHNKGRPGAEQAGADEAWEHRYEFTGTTLQDFPLPTPTPVKRAKLLDDLAHDLQEQNPAQVANRQTPTASALDAARGEYERLLRLMVTHQEELDWEYYRIYGLIEDDLTYNEDTPEIKSSERTFAIVLARAMKEGSTETTWFVHHNHQFTPLTEIPEHLPTDYRALMQRRLDAIESNPHIRLLERPEFKRRWNVEPWEKQVEAALRDWLLDRVEDRSLWYDKEGRPVTQSVAQLADILDRNEDFRKTLRLWAGDPNIATGTALAKLLADEAVPFLAAYRYKPAGLEKRAAWEQTWVLQRREDAGEKLDGPIAVPPKYKQADFVKGSYWSRRGKLDVPKERFICYPNAGRDTDATELLGWAGWDHADQALALAGLISQRIDEGWETAKLIPLLAGLHELAPRVRQWHNQIDPEYGESVADTIDDELTARLGEHHLTVTDLTSWRPAPTRRGRRTKKS